MASAYLSNYNLDIIDLQHYVKEQRFLTVKVPHEYIYALFPRREFVLFIIFSKTSETQKRLRTAI